MTDPLRWQPYRDGTRDGEKILWRRRHNARSPLMQYGRAEWDGTPGPDGDDGPCWVDLDDGCIAVDFDEFILYPEEPTP